MFHVKTVLFKTSYTRADNHEKLGLPAYIEDTGVYNIRCTNNTF